MRLIHDPEELFATNAPLVLAAGFFDGVHLGHQLLLRQARHRAQELGGETWALTFDEHPLSVLAPTRRPLLLTDREERLRLLAQTGIDGALLFRFTRDFARIQASDFLAHLLPQSAPSARCLLLCGENWRFGARAAGTPNLLAELGRPFGLGVEVVPYAYYRNLPVSSTRIRAAVQAGRMTEVRAMLGRAWLIESVVGKGQQRGRTLGFPTANLPYPRDLAPPFGVYAVWLRTADGIRLPAVANFGIHPTVGALAHPQVEVHAFDPPAQGLEYGSQVQVEFVAYIRSEKKFATEAELVAQIRQDAAVARRELSGP